MYIQTVRGTVRQRQRSMRHIFSPENLLSTALLMLEEGTMEFIGVSGETERRTIIIIIIS